MRKGRDKQLAEAHQRIDMWAVKLKDILGPADTAEVLMIPAINILRHEVGDKATVKFLEARIDEIEKPDDTPIPEYLRVEALSYVERFHLKPVTALLVTSAVNLLRKDLGGEETMHILASIAMEQEGK